MRKSKSRKWKVSLHPNPWYDLQARSNYAVEERSPCADSRHHEGQLVLNIFTGFSSDSSVPAILSEVSSWFFIFVTSKKGTVDRKKHEETIDKDESDSPSRMTHQCKRHRSVFCLAEKVSHCSRKSWKLNETLCSRSDILIRFTPEDKNVVTLSLYSALSCSYYLAYL